MDTYRLNSDRSAAVSNDTYWNEDMSTCPRGTKVQLLGEGGAAVYSHYNGDSFWVGWCPVPRRAPAGLPTIRSPHREKSQEELENELKALGYDLDKLEQDSPYHFDPYA